MIYTIKEGGHYSNHFPKIYFGKREVNFSFRFFESCIYNIGHPDQFDINKLFGVSFGDHQNNSIRVGWNWETESQKINLFLYTYNKGVRDEEFIMETDINVGLTGKITMYDNSFSLVIYGKGKEEIKMKEFDYPTLRWGYYLYPYFGGNVPAPHEMKIDLSF